MITKLDATSIDTQTSRLLLNKVTQSLRLKSIGNNSVIRKRETSIAWLKWMMIWPNAISIGTMMS